MINFDEYTNENKIEHNSKWPYIPDNPYRILIVGAYHVTYAFQSESTLYSCLNVKELLARSRREI